MKTPAPAYVHHPLSHLNLQQNDCTYASYLLMASQIQDPKERMKLVVAFYMGGFFINPTLL